MLFILRYSSLLLTLVLVFSPMLEVSARDSTVNCSLSIRSRFLLIGEFLKFIPSFIPELYERVDLAARAGAEVVEIIARTSEVEDDTSQLDGLVRLADERGLCVIIKFVVNSNKLGEIYLVEEPARDEFTIPDYVNATQLEYGKSLLRRLIRHYDTFPNVAGYQIDWGFWGESWIPWTLWPSASSNASFISFLHSLSEQFSGFNTANYARWPLAGAYQGSMMFHSKIFDQSDPRHDPLNVAAFYWYQHWRNSMQVNITKEFRSTARAVTNKPILGFSYTHTSMNVMAYSYTADEGLYGCYCDTNPGIDKRSGNPATPNDFTIRDAKFEGLHIVDLDFDTPYFRYEDAETAVASLYARGILPKVFWPQWSKGLSFERVRALMELIGKYRDYASQSYRGEVLLVTGNIDVGIYGYKNPLSPAHLSTLMSRSPPGIIQTLETNGIQFDIVDGRVYRPELGAKYKVVIVHTPRDTLDGELYRKLRETPRPVVVMHSSFTFSSPTFEKPTETASAYFENSNPVGSGSDRVYVEIWGYPPSVVVFRGFLSDLPRLTDYKPNWLSSTYRGSFDEVLATANVEAGTVIARKGNVYFFGLDLSTQNLEHNRILQAALLRILSKAGIRPEPGLSKIISENIIVAKVHDGKPHYIPTGGKAPVDYPFFNGTHIVTASAVTTRLNNLSQPYILEFPEDTIKHPAQKTFNGTHYIISFVTGGGRFLMYVPTIPEKLTLNGLDIPWKWTKYSVIEFLIPLSAETAERKLVLILSPFPSEIRETKTLTITKTMLSQETVTAYATRIVTATPSTITATITSRETTTVHETKTTTIKETIVIQREEVIPTTLLLLTIAISGLLVVSTLFMKKRKTKHG
jgi:hypothetical protein